MKTNKEFLELIIKNRPGLCIYGHYGQCNNGVLSISVLNSVCDHCYENIIHNLPGNAGKELQYEYIARSINPFGPNTVGMKLWMKLNIS